MQAAAVESAVQSRTESRRVLLVGLAALTKIVEHVTQGEGAQLPPAQSCRMAVQGAGCM